MQQNMGVEQGIAARRVYHGVSRHSTIACCTVAALLFMLSLALSGCARLLVPTPPVAADSQRELVVFAAASLTDALTELEPIFEAEHPGVDVLMNFGASSRLATQLLEGATADVFASANQAQMANVAAGGLVSAGPYIFASNRLVIITPANNPAGIQELADLATPGINLILAVPGVPIRDYSDQILTAASKPDALGADFAAAVYANLVSEEDNVRQVVAKVALGEADAGIVYTSDVTPDVAADLATVAIPDQFNLVATYPIAPLNSGLEPELAAEFVDLVRSEQGGAVFSKWGFGPADARAADE